MRMRNTTLCLCLGLALAGCSERVVVSEPVAGSLPPSQAEPGGLVYSLPKTIITVTGTKDATTGKVSYTIVPSIVPDSRARYRLRYTASGVTDDDLNLSVNASGLLTSTAATVTDRTGDIVIQLARTAQAAATLLGATAPAPAAPVKPADVYPFTKIFDAEDFVGGRPDSVVTRTLPDGVSIVVPNWKPLDDVDQVPPPCASSVCFRTVVPLRASIGIGGAQTDVAMLVVDPFRTEGIDLRTAVLVTRTNTVTFDGGIITAVAINKPSSVLALASLPLNVIKAVLAVPTELLTLRINNVNSEASLVAAQTGVATNQAAAQTAAVTSQGELVAAQTTLANNLKARLDALAALKAARAATPAGGVVPSVPVGGTP